jgi:hypothetical protein
MTRDDYDMQRGFDAASDASATGINRCTCGHRRGRHAEDALACVECECQRFKVERGVCVECESARVDPDNDENLCRTCWYDAHTQSIGATLQDEVMP